MPGYLWAGIQLATHLKFGFDSGALLERWLSGCKRLRVLSSSRTSTRPCGRSRKVCAKSRALSPYFSSLLSRLAISIASEWKPGLHLLYLFGYCGGGRFRTFLLCFRTRFLFSLNVQGGQVGGIFPASLLFPCPDYVGSQYWEFPPGVAISPPVRNTESGQ